MKHTLDASRRIRPHAETLASPALWISDRLLADTFERFSRGCRRHGSHVPGPLEARRRAAKRKSTTFACSTPSRAPIEASDLFGAGSHGRWWDKTKLGQEKQPPSTNSEASFSTSFLSSWFSEPPPAPSQTDLVQRQPEAERISEPKSALQKQLDSFKAALADSRTLEGVCSLIKELNPDAFLQRRFSKLAFQHILDSFTDKEGDKKGLHSTGPWKISDLQDIFLDPTLSPPGSSHYSAILDKLQLKPHSFYACDAMLNILCQAVSIGIFPSKDIEDLITRLPDVRVIQKGQSVLLGTTDQIHEYYSRVLLSIDECRVLNVSDLDQDFIASWLVRIERHPFSACAARILWRFRQNSPSTESEMALALTKRWLEGPRISAKTLRRRKLVEFLDMLPASVLVEVLIKATNFIMVSTMQHRHGYDGQMMKEWHTFLVGLREQTVWRAFSEPEAWKKTFDEPLVHDDHAQLVLIVSWTAINTAKQTKYWKRLLQSLDFSNLFKQVFGTKDVLAQVLQALQAFPLPYTHSLLRNLRFVTENYLVLYNNVSVLRQSLEKLTGRDFVGLQDFRTYQSMTRECSEGLVKCAESVNNNIPLLLRVSRACIEQDRFSFNIIIRILRHNLALHNALSQSGRPEYRSLGSDINPRDALDLINHLAVSFATSDVVTPPQALQKVYWCFWMLHRYGAPIQPVITRALWHVGVTRRGDIGVPKALFKWIFKQVRLVEGEEVAKALYENRSFREYRDEEFRQLTNSSKSQDENDIPAELSVSIGELLEEVEDNDGSESQDGENLSAESGRNLDKPLEKGDRSDGLEVQAWQDEKDTPPKLNLTQDTLMKKGEDSDDLKKEDEKDVTTQSSESFRRIAKGE